MSAPAGATSTRVEIQSPSSSCRMILTFCRLTDVPVGTRRDITSVVGCNNDDIMSTLCRRTITSSTFLNSIWLLLTQCNMNLSQTCSGLAQGIRPPSQTWVLNTLRPAKESKGKYLQGFSNFCGQRESEGRELEGGVGFGGSSGHQRKIRRTRVAPEGPAGGKLGRQSARDCTTGGLRRVWELNWSGSEGSCRWRGSVVGGGITGVFVSIYHSIHLPQKEEEKLGVKLQNHQRRNIHSLFPCCSVQRAVTRELVFHSGTKEHSIHIGVEHLVTETVFLSKTPEVVSEAHSTNKIISSVGCEANLSQGAPRNCGYSSLGSPFFCLVVLDQLKNMLLEELSMYNNQSRRLFVILEGLARLLTGECTCTGSCDEIKSTRTSAPYNITSTQIATVRCFDWVSPTASTPLYNPLLAIYHLNHNICLTLKIKTFQLAAVPSPPRLPNLRCS
ncbi:hypothetical protein VP01_1503g2 [Puccinia sorghi]|uniref:Uncharacterized protein n=1 Tax=Puccinia sorghi TaxID=27349 RepID=A0A0L6VJ35_9BASI|nr:hypothetical protein VP01_1503g2 [Puccinia sorghi]